MEALSDPIVGIDLGTSNSVVAHADGSGAVRVFADDGGYKIHPSVVSFHPGGGVVVGAAAKQRKVIDPQNTIYSVKRLIGRGYRSPEVQTAMARVPYQIKEGAGQMPMIATRGGELAVPEISAIVLDHVRSIAAARLGTAVTRAVVTVPASFGDVQRSATATAGAIAGLTVVRLLNEPTAAALAYGHARALHDVIAVYDFGGGTFDVSILRLDDQVYEVLGTAGDTFLGGDDLDERLVDKMVAKFLADHRVDLRTNEVAMMRLRAVAEQTKIELSRRARAVVRVDEIAYGPRGAPLNLQIEIARDEFVREIADLIDRTFPVCQEALQLAGVTIDRVGDVLLVGGTTKIPHVREQVGRFFQKPPRADLGPEDAVAIGAALHGAALEQTLTRPRAASSPTTTETLELEPSGDARTSSALIAPGADRARHATSGAFDARESSEPSVTRPDTSYSVTRAGTKDTYDGRAPSPLPGLFDDLTPPPQGQPIGRMTRPPTVDPDELGAPAPPQARTLFGVPQGPRSPGAASSTLDIPTLHPTTQPAMPAAARPPNPTSWGDEDGKVRPPPPPPQSPTSETTAARPPPVPAASPSAPTLFGAPLDPAAMRAAPPAGAGLSGPTGLSDPAAASTAKGFGAPSGALLDDPAQAALRLVGPAGSTARGYQAPAPPPRPPVVLEVTPRGLGIGTVAGYCEELIRRNSRVPAETRKLFTTSRDRQDVVRIVVCQGESRRLDHNVVIGDLVLAGLPPRPRGETSIEVTFSLDASGILQVHARDALTGAEQRAELDLIGSMPQQDVAASRDRLQLLRR